VLVLRTVEYINFMAKLSFVLLSAKTYQRTMYRIGISVLVIVVGLIVTEVKSFSLQTGAKCSDFVDLNRPGCPSRIPRPEQFQYPTSANRQLLARYRNTHPTRAQSSARFMSNMINNAISASTAPSILNVALDQPLYPPLNSCFREKGLSGLVKSALLGLMGSVKLMLLKCKQFLVPSLEDSTFSVLIVKLVAVLTVLLLYSTFTASSTVGNSSNVLLRPIQLVWNGIRQMMGFDMDLASTTTVVPMPFEPSTNEGWAVCKLRSIRQYGKTSFLQVDFTLPKSNFVLPLALGQTIQVCGLDRNGKAVQADFYPFQLNRQIKPGTFSLLVPNPSKGYLTNGIGSTDEADGNNNGVQQLRVVQVLQDYVLTGDKEIALQPGSCQLEYRGTHYPVTEIVYVVVGTGIAPVLDQIRVVLTPAYSSSSSSSTSGIENVSLVWINDSLADFDITTDLLQQEHERHSSKLNVTCGIVENLKSITKEQAATYFVQNNVEINDTIPTYQPGMMLVIAIEGLQSSSLLKQVATQFVQQNKGFPSDCICVL
jgi:hypothetical protein